MRPDSTCAIIGGTTLCLCDEESGYVARGLTCVLGCDGVDCGAAGACELYYGAPLCMCSGPSTYPAGTACRASQPGRTLGQGELRAIAPAPSGMPGAVVAGARVMSGENRITFARLDAAGGVVWEQVGPAGYASAIATLDDGDIVVGGQSGSSAWLTRVGPDGVARAGFPRALAGYGRVRALAGGSAIDALLMGASLVWTRLDAAGSPTGAVIDLGAPGPYAERLLRRTRDGGAIAVASPGGRLTLSKISAAGALAWQRELGGMSSVVAGGVAETASGYVVLGDTTVAGAQVLYIAGTSATGERLWSEQLAAGTARSFGLCDDGSCVVALADRFAPLAARGGYLYGGGYVAGIDTLGHVTWHGMYGSSVVGADGSSARSVLYDALRMPSGETWVVGTTVTIFGGFTGTGDALLLRLDGTGRAL